jgi:hypothetical protein
MEWWPPLASVDTREVQDVFAALAVGGQMAGYSRMRDIVTTRSAVMVTGSDHVPASGAFQYRFMVDS